MLSQRRLRPSVCRTSQNEYEDVITSIDAVEMLAPEPGGRRIAGPLRTVTDKIGRQLALDFVRRPIPQAIAPRSTPEHGPFDLFFMVVQHPSDLNILQALPDWRQLCAKAIVFIEELWVIDLKYEKMLRPLKQFDHVLIGTTETAEPLQQIIGKPCHPGHVGVDAIRFCPLPNSPVRTIDFLSMGRRSARTHAALMKMARSRDFYYEYDTIKAKYVLDTVEHRELLANRIKRSRYFLANRPKVDAEHQTARQEEMGMRFFEGAAGGAIMIGDRPRTPYWDQLFDWPDACIDLPFDSEDIEDVLEGLEQQPERLARIRRDNVVNSLNRHDWAYRFQQILRLAGMNEHPNLHKRLQQLARLSNEASVEMSPAAASAVASAGASATTSAGASAAGRFMVR